MAFPLPECWSDDDRMNFLFQPFRPKEANPVSYDAKMKFWTETICEYMKFQVQNGSGVDGKYMYVCNLFIFLFSFLHIYVDIVL